MARAKAKRSNVPLRKSLPRQAKQSRTSIDRRAPGVKAAYKKKKDQADTSTLVGKNQRPSKL